MSRPALNTPEGLAALTAARALEARDLARKLNSLGDRVGPNDMALSNALWAASQLIRSALGVA